MDHINADKKNLESFYLEGKQLKNLDDLAVYLATGFLSLNTLHNNQVRAIQIGIMPEDLNERANTIAYDIRRLMKLYETQLGEVLNLLPDDFSAQDTIKNLSKRMKKLAKTKVKRAQDEIRNI
jgi:hypothetical protein